ncbi:hypothetical protein [Streptomyces tendae]|uniref:hypothetical protein n=1 Tax=Streptomyces tendae TaxID=1932 RepID=UPI0033C63E7B
MADETLTAFMRAINLIERIHKDGAEVWQTTWESTPDHDHTALLLSQIVGFLLENDAARRGVSWDDLFDQFRQEAVEHLG